MLMLINVKSKYNQCYLHLNTSNVNVNLLAVPGKVKIELNLNTSNVNVNLYNTRYS